MNGVYNNDYLSICKCWQIKTYIAQTLSYFENGHEAITCLYKTRQYRRLKFFILREHQQTENSAHISSLRKTKYAEMSRLF